MGCKLARCRRSQCDVTQPIDGLGSSCQQIAGSIELEVDPRASRFDHRVLVSQVGKPEHGAVDGNDNERFHLARAERDIPENDLDVAAAWTIDRAMWWCQRRCSATCDHDDDAERARNTAHWIR